MGLRDTGRNADGAREILVVPREKTPTGAAIFIESVMLSNHLILCCPFFSCLQSFPALAESWPVWERLSVGWVIIILTFKAGIR